MDLKLYVLRFILFVTVLLLTVSCEKSSNQQGELQVSNAEVKGYADLTATDECPERSVIFLWFGVFVLFFCVIVLLVILYKRIRNEEKRLESMVQKRTGWLNEERKLLECKSLADQLTGLPNRRNFDMRLDMEWRIAIRKRQAISFLMLDIDNFKMHNDKHGHQHGDEVLQMIAKTIEQTLKRPGDFAARWGGEEFAVLLSNTDTDGALIVAESIRTNVEKMSLYHSGVNIKVTISIGVNTQKPEPNSSLSAFISAADNELYKAKRAGKNRVSLLKKG